MKHINNILPFNTIRLGSLGSNRYLQFLRILILLLFFAFGATQQGFAQKITYGGNYDISAYTTGTSVVLDVSGEEGGPQSMLFNGDGSILYVLGLSEDDINAYPLDTPYDISSYTTGTSVVLVVSGEEGLPSAMLFNGDGSILYVTGRSGDDINAYPLGTPYDISSYSSGTSVVLDVSGQESGPTAMLFNDDGSILYVTGYTGNDINAYPLGTPYDISSYTTGTSVVLNVSGQETSIRSMLFNDDGSIFYVTGNDGDDIDAYPLDTPYDISSYSTGTSVVLDVVAQEASPTDMLFNEDGSILYLLGSSGDDINAYPLAFKEYPENVSNTGTINNTETLKINLEDDTFVDLGSGVLTSGQVTVGNVPAGLTAVLTIASSTQVVLTFTGTAILHDDIHDVSNLTFAFTNSAFTGGDASLVVNSGSVTPYDSNVGINFLLNPATAPVITSNGGGATGAISIVENTTAVTTVVATDVNAADVITYSISGGADAAKFSINATTGVLTFTAAPDYENPTDLGDTAANNTYVVDITATDDSAGTLTDVQTLTITVTNIQDGVLTYGKGHYDISAYTTGTSVVLDVSGQEGSPQTMLFNGDGSILYVMGPTDDDIYAYPLGTPYDLSSYSTGIFVVFDVGGEEANPTAMLFNEDGSILYVTGYAGDDINAYPLGTPYDLSSYTIGTSVVLDVSGEETNPTAMLFNDDGSILYVTGYAGDDINAYPLGTPYDISSYSSGTSVVLDVSGEETVPRSMLFNDDGSILYVMGSADDDINAYPLGTPYDISSYTTGTSVVLGLSYAPTDMLFNGDGSTLYILDGDNEINAYPLVVPDSFTEVLANDGSVTGELNFTITGDTFVDAGGGTLNPASITITNLPVGLSIDNIALSNGNTEGVITLTGNATNHQVIDDIADLTITFADAAFTGGNASLVVNSGAITPASTNTPVNFLLNPVLSYGKGGYDISTYTTGTSMVLDVSGQEVFPTDILFNADGSILYVIGQSGDDINAYPLDTPYDISSYSSGTSVVLSVGGQEANPEDMLFNEDGSILYVMGLSGDDINAYPLGTPYDISSYSSGTSVVLSVLGQDTNPTDMLFNGDGSILYVMGYEGDDINAYPLGTPYDISSYSSGTSVVLSVSGQETIPRSMIFNGDGSILYVMGLSGDDINAYPLGTPYDISSYSSGTSVVLDVSAQDTNPTAMLFNGDGSILYLIGYAIDAIHAFPLVVVPDSFTEVPANDGSVTGELNFTITGDTFVDAGGGTLNPASITITNLPVGLSINDIALSNGNTEGVITLTGNATNHQVIDDIADLTITFADAAFTGGNASLVVNSGAITPASTNTPVNFLDNPCDAVASGNTDTDGDGISDICDLDDDNDGILDVNDEMASLDVFSALPQSITTTTTTAQTLTGSGGVAVDVTLSSPSNAYETRQTIFYTGYRIGNENIDEEITFSFSQPVTEIRIYSVGLDYNISGNEEVMRLEVNGVAYTFDSANFVITAGDPYISVDGLSIVGPLSGGPGVFDYTVVMPEGITSMKLINDYIAGGPNGAIYDVRLSGGVLGPADTDTDGILDYLDLDSDNDGISDLVESGFANSAYDLNNDGTITIAEAEAVLGVGNADADGDGLMDIFDANTSDNTAAASIGTIPQDFDGDLRPNYLDLDSDGDGIPDTIEARLTAGYIANDGDVTNNDLDGDGIIDLFDSNDGDGITALFGGSFLTPEDTDSDTTFDYLDTDSDDDTLLDSAESGLTLSGTDANNDGIDDDATIAASYTDPDGTINDPQTNLANETGDTTEVGYREVPDPCDPIASGNTDTDGDGISDICDLDDDNDGILDTEECFDLVISNTFLVDAIANGTATVVEGSASGTPSVNDAGPGGNELGLRYIDVAGGITYYQLGFGGADFSRLDGRNVHMRLNIDDYSATNTWLSTLVPGTNDFRLIGNGGDQIEAQINADPFLDVQVLGTFEVSYIISQANFSGTPAQFDAILANLEFIQIRAEFWGGTTGVVESELIPFLTTIVPNCDTDGDGIPNHLDLDSDNDGISDFVESGFANSAYDLNNDGTITIAEAEAILGVGNADADGDGLMDIFDANTSDNTAAASIGTIPQDFDGDLRPNYLDLDSDADGIPDTIESRPSAGYLTNDGDVTDNDADGDGVIDIFDSNDGTSAIFGGSFAPLEDTDNDGTPDYLDLDSDNDTLLDIAESGLTLSGTDANGDGIDDDATTGASYANPDGVINAPLGTTNGLLNIDTNTTDVDFRSVPLNNPMRHGKHFMNGKEKQMYFGKRGNN